MKKTLYFILFNLFLIGCKEKYVSPVISPATGYLVVEGIINSGAGETNIVLSRTTALNNQKILAEAGASVMVESEDKTSFLLKETKSGNYGASNLNLVSTKKYKLTIQTKDGKKYESDFVPVQSNPPIDSVNWTRAGRDVQLYVNTHDPKNNTKYYQWEYVETWELHTYYLSTLKYKAVPNSRGVITYSAVYNDSTSFAPDLSKYFCWKTESSTSIFTGTTTNLSSDIIQLPLIKIPADSWKLNILYSVNTKQYSLSKGRYEFLQRMKRNTETTGSVFDAQPSELNSNIRCVSNPNEPVIGYIDICPIQEKRIYINRKSLPDWNYTQSCSEVEIPNISDSILIKALFLLPTYPNTDPMTGRIISFYAAPPECVDCKLKGSSIKPSFWPN
jgi:hypothetical protein